MPATPLAQRVVTAVVLALVVLAALFVLPALGWALFVLAILAVGTHEWARLAGYGSVGEVALVVVVVVSCLGLLALPAFGFAQGWPPWVVVAVCGTSAAFWLLVAPAWLATAWTTRGRLASGAAGIVVITGAWVAVVDLQSRSPWLVLAAMAVVWIADTAAYFSGRRFGRRKLAPSISPGKTWEGVAGALAAVALYAFVLVIVTRRAGFDGTVGVAGTIAFVVLLPMLAAISVVGDLYESMLKRHAGVKDSGALLPGHGGVLDRIDALLAAMPFAALAATAWLARTAAA